MSRGPLLSLLAACAGEAAQQPPSDGASGDAPTGCSVFVMAEPGSAVAAPSTQIRATAVVSGAAGVLTYAWQVKRQGVDVAYAPAQPDRSAITFFTPMAGPYDVIVAIGGSSAFCPTGERTINITAPGANLDQVRMRVYPPRVDNQPLAPVQERLQLVTGGADLSAGNVTVEQGVLASGMVRNGGSGVQAYLRFIPLAAREAYVEAWSRVDGSFDNVRVVNELHDVLVVPIQPGVAPRLVKSYLPNLTSLDVDAGTAVSGVARDPGGNGIAGAHVQLLVDGVPSTLATTNASGQFTVRAAMPANVPVVTVEVTPPMATGLPRIRGASSSISLTSAITVQFSAALVRRDLGGTVVRRAGAAQPNAPVKIVGTIGAVATINGSINANGEVRIASVANGAGAIPSGTLAPASPLFAVSTIGSELAVSSFDLTTTVPASIDAPAAAQVTTRLHDHAAQSLPGAILELTPVGPLAMAGASTIRGTADGAGDVRLAVPAGGSFDVRASDPLGRAAPAITKNVTAIASSYPLKKKLLVTGKLLLSGNPNPVGRANVQILCTLCSGNEFLQPIAESASAPDGTFGVPVVDPGVAN